MHLDKENAVLIILFLFADRFYPTRLQNNMYDSNQKCFATSKLRCIRSSICFPLSSGIMSFLPIPF